MLKIKSALLCTLALLAVGGLTTTITRAADSEWVHPGPDGKLVYKTTPTGDRIMDFSHAGYMGGGIPLPEVATAISLSPLGDNKDDTANIQAAIDKLAKLPLKNNFHGAIQLAPGTFICSATLNLSTSGIVLRGSGSAGPNATTIKITGAKHRAVNIGAPQRRGADRPPSDDDPAPAAEPTAKEEFTAAQTTIADAYVPAGATTLTLADAKNFQVNDMIIIRRPTTEAWLHLMQMDTLKRDGKPQTWIGKNRSGTQERKITSISNSKITLDIPLADSYDSKYLNQTTITKQKPANALSQIGLEHLHFQCPPLETAYGQAPYSGVRVAAEDSWVKDVYFEETMNTTTLSAKRITMENVTCTHTFPNLGASKPTDFSIETSQALIDRCHITGDNMYFVWTASLDAGPNVILNSTFRGRGSRIQPHMRWSTALLVDNCTVPDGGIDFPNRGVAGSGHGWTMGWAVAWNNIASTYIIQQPPGAMNWAIGNIGQRQQTARYFDTGPILPEGTFDSHGTPVTPQSLYLAQLEERAGPVAIKNIGYFNTKSNPFPDKQTPKLPSLAPAPDPQLGPDLAFHRPVTTSNNRTSDTNNPRQYVGEKALDSNPNTYWATEQAGDRITLELDMEGPVDINTLALSEDPAHTGRIQQYKVEAQVQSDWLLLSEGTTIGTLKTDHFPKTTAWKVRLTLLKTTDYPALSRFSLYLAPPTK